jgi:Cof subfamily protein (haloacid dehalogenase superfamily)
MAIRLIALDLDGTSLDSANRLRPSTKRAVVDARARGVEVVLVTGRHHVVTRPYYDEFELSSPAICCNGTYVHDFARGEPVLGTHMDKDAARTMLRLSRRHDVHILLYVRDAMTFEVPTPHLDGLQAWAATFPVDRRPRIERIESFETAIDEAPLVWKLVVSGDDAEAVKRWHAEASAVPGFNIESSWAERWDVMVDGSSKGPRLLEWAATRGIAAEEILAFGDNLNDVTMISSAGWGVAMGNAAPGLKAVANEVIGDNDGDDIAAVIERMTA